MANGGDLVSFMDQASLQFLTWASYGSDKDDDDMAKTAPILDGAYSFI